MVSGENIDLLISISVGGIITAALIPVALQQLAAADFTNVSGSGVDVDLSVSAMYGLIAIAVIVVTIVVFFNLI